MTMVSCVPHLRDFFLVINGLVWNTPLTNLAKLGSQGPSDPWDFVFPRKVGILEEQQAFWASIFPQSEMRAATWEIDLSSHSWFPWEIPGFFLGAFHGRFPNMIRDGWVVHPK